MYLAALIVPDMRNLSSLFPQSWLFASVSQQTVAMKSGFSYGMRQAVKLVA